MKRRHVFSMLCRHFILHCPLMLGAAFLLNVAAYAQVKHPASSHRSFAVASDVPSGFLPGAIHIFAGNGTAGGAYADGSVPTDVSIGPPTALATDSQGNIFFAGDQGNTVFVVYEGGKVPPVLAAVTTQASPAVTPVKGDIYQVTAVTSNCNYCYTDAIPAAQAYLNNIQGMSFDSSDNLYIAAGLNMYCVFEMNEATTQLHVVAGQFDLPSSYAQGDTIDGVAATSVGLSDPTDVKTDSFGNIYITDEGNVVALVVYAGSQPPPVLAAEGVSVSAGDKGNIYTIAGQVQNFCLSPGTCTDAGPARGSLISGAISLSVDAAGNIYVLDNYAYTVRVIYSGVTVPPLLSTVVHQPQSGSIYTIAGLDTQFTPCSAANCGDGGKAADVLFNSPLYLAVDADGNVYVDDSFDHAIRKIDIAGIVSTVAGIADPNATPPAVPSGGGPATGNPLNLPSTIVFDTQDNLYIADNGYNIVWNVGPAQPQSITFPKLDSPVTYGAGQIPLDATATSGLAVQYAVTGPAIVSGTGSTAELNVTGAGTVMVTASQLGNAEYASAVPISQTVTVNKALLTVTAIDATKTHGQPNPTFTAAYSGFVNGDTQANAISGQPVITTTATTNSGSGTYPLTISQGTLASSNYSFTFVNGTFTITGAATQSITFPPLASVTYGQKTTVTLNASASSGLPIQYAVLSGPGSISGSTLTITGGGTIVISASQTGNNTYAGATSVSQSLIVNPASLTIAAPDLSYPYGTAIDPTMFPPPVITGFIGNDNASLVSGNAVYTTNASGTPHGGTYSLTVAQGTLALVPQAAANYTLAHFVSGSLTITPAPQIISTLPLPAVFYNTLYSVTASASSGLPVTVTATGPLAIYGGNVTVPGTGNNNVQFYANGVGPASLVLTQTGTSDYAVTTPVVLRFNANKAELDIQANNQIREQGAPDPTFTYTIGANVQPGPLGGFVDIPSIVSGIPTLTTTATQSSPPGAYPIQPALGTLSSPVYFFNFINGVLTITPPGSFVITVNPSSLTIPGGMSGQATITITPTNAYQGMVTLSCGQLPANVTCIVSPATYTFPGSQNADGSENAAQGTITVNTTVGQVVGELSAQPSTPRLAGFFFPGAIAVLYIAFALRRTSRNKIGWSLCFLIIAGAGIISLASCGGSKGSSGIAAKPGTSVVTISGSGTTPSGNGNVTASVPLTVIIQ